MRDFPMPYKLIVLAMIVSAFFTLGKMWCMSKPEGKKQQFTEVIVNNKPFKIVKEWRD